MPGRAGTPNFADIRVEEWTQHGKIQSGGSATSQEGSGAANILGIQDTSSGLVIDAIGLGFEQTAGAATNAFTEIQAVHSRRDHNPFLHQKVGVDSPTDLRAWFGLWSIATNTMLGSDDPAASIIAVGCRVADTNWFFFTKDGTTLKAVDTGIDIATNPEILWNFIVDHTGAAIDFELRDPTDPFLLRFSARVTANLPAAATSLRMGHGIRANGAAARTMTNYKQEFWNR